MTHRVAIVLLAAGASRRMQGRDKLMETIDGTPLLRRVADVAWASTASEIVIVLGAMADARFAALESLPFRITQNPQWETGMASSIGKGIESLDAGVDAALILLADMPDISAALIDGMIEAFNPDRGVDIVRPVSASGPVGNPVLFGRRHFPALTALTGDVGAKSVIASNASSVLDYPTSDDSILVDLDTPEAWGEWKSKQ